MDPTKRQRIVEAATEYFVRSGFKRTSIDEIAEKAGVGKGTVYLACESKAELFYQAVHADLQAWAAQLARCVDPRRPAAEILTQMATDGVRYLADHPLVRDLFAGIHEGTLPDWVEQFDELRMMGRETVAQVLRLGIRRGELRDDLDVELVSAVLQDIQHSGYIVYGERWMNDPAAADERLRAQMTLILDGLRVRER